MGEGVAIIDEDGVVAGHACPARDARNDRGAARDRRGGLDPSLEDRADDALVPELVAGAEPALGRELRHPRRGAGAAGAAVDGLLAVEHGVARMRARDGGRTRPLDVAEAADLRMLGMDEVVLLVQRPAPLRRPADKLAR